LGASRLPRLPTGDSAQSHATNRLPSYARAFCTFDWWLPSPRPSGGHRSHIGPLDSGRWGQCLFGVGLSASQLSLLWLRRGSPAACRAGPTQPAGLNLHSSWPILRAWPRSPSRRRRSSGKSTRLRARPSGWVTSRHRMRPPRWRRPPRNLRCRPDRGDEGSWKMRAQPMDEVARPGRSLIAADGFLLQRLDARSGRRRSNTLCSSRVAPFISPFAFRLMLGRLRVPRSLEALLDVDARW
jgi:hypothetical protein